MFKEYHDILQEKELCEVMGEENTHVCREPPFEAAIYNLKAEGQNHEKFKANSTVALNIQIEGATDQHLQKKIEHCSLELPVDFSKDDVTRVRIILIGYIYLTCQPKSLK